MLAELFAAQISFRRGKQDQPRWDPHPACQGLFPNPVSWWSKAGPPARYPSRLASPEHAVFSVSQQKRQCRTLSLAAVFPFAAVAVLRAEPGVRQLFGESRQPPLSITPCGFGPSVPPASPGSVFLRGNATRLQPVPRLYTASQPRMSRLSRKKEGFLF